MSGAGSGNSSAGSAGVMQAGDQRNAKDSEQNADRFHEGKTNSHVATDSKDQRTIANRLAAAEQESESSEQGAGKRDPTAPARMHGNKPSRGAEIDAELQAEDEATLKKKGN